MKGDQAHNLSTTFNSSFAWQMRHEQESRGGITVAGSAKAKELNDYNLEVLMRRQQTPKHEIVTTAMNGWMFYFLERIANVWRSTQGTKEEITLKGGKRATNTKGERAYRVVQAQPTSQPDGAQDDQAQVRYVNIKGQGAWHSWQSWFRRQTQIYNNDDGLRLKWAQKALTYQEENPIQPARRVPPKPILNASETWMEMGDEHGPLRVEFVKECCEKWTNETDISHPTHGREAGTVSAGRKIRKFHEGRNMIMDDKTKRPDKALPTLHNIKKICWESMPGLCDADPADLKTVTTKVRCNLNTQYALHRLGRNEPCRQVLAIRVCDRSKRCTSARRPSIAIYVWGCVPRLRALEIATGATFPSNDFQR